MSIYTVMLIMAMVFMLIAVIAMAIEFRRWGPDYWNTRSARPQASTVTSTLDFAT